jgi:hypothetical protein
MGPKLDDESYKKKFVIRDKHIDCHEYDVLKDDKLYQ